MKHVSASLVLAKLFHPPTIKLMALSNAKNNEHSHGDIPTVIKMNCMVIATPSTFLLVMMIITY